MKRKYELTETTMEHDGKIFYQIRSLTTLLEKNVSYGTLGGWIEDISCLSQRETAWVSDDARVEKGSIVDGHAWVKGKAIIRSGSHILHYAHISDSVEVSNSKCVDKCIIGGNVSIENSHIGGEVILKDDACVTDSRLLGELEVLEQASLVKCNFHRQERVKINGRAKLNEVTVFRKANVHDVLISDDTSLCCVDIKGSYIQVLDQAHVEHTVLEGSHINFIDFAWIKGKVVVGSKTVLGGLCELMLEEWSEYPLSGIEVHHDVVINDDNYNLFI